jgi:predicted enzyme related to lactoylglutathione lyase
MQSNPVGWTEIPAKDLGRAETFYKDFFGFEMTRQPEANGDEMSWFPMDEGYGAGGALVKGESYIPSRDGVLVYFTAPGGVDAALQKAREMNIEVVMEKTQIGEHGLMAVIIDSEGNKIALHEAPSQA